MILGAGLLVALPAAAQPLAQRRAEVRQRVAEWGMQQTIAQLQLEPAQVPRFRELWSRYQQQLDAVNGETSRALKELRQQLMQPTPDEARLRTLSDLVLANRAKAQELEHQRSAELRTLLTVTQYARGVVFAPELRKQLHDRMQQAMHGGSDGE
jgi:hypothetical protein